jgi:myo-inositol-1(or 4)-monophosphatase
MRGKQKFHQPKQKDKSMTERMLLPFIILSNPMANLQELLPKVIKVSKEAGAFIRRELETFDVSRIEHKGLNDMVSYVDKEAEKLIVKGLKEALPEAGFITEEGTEGHDGETYRWVIDPLDGTTNFIHGLPLFAVSLALIREEKVVLGVVYEVNRDECFYAHEGGKAFCNGKEIRVSQAESLKDSLVATGFPYAEFEDLPAYMQVLQKLMKNSHGLRRMGSAAVDLAYVACGRFEGYFEYNLNAWDVAAGALIVKQAGGIVSDFEGGNKFLFGRQILAASNHVHGELLKTITDHF